MDFNIGMAVLGGLVGTIAMTMVMYMGSMMGMKIDMPMTLGTMFLSKGSAAWGLGLMIHLMMGIVFFIIYATLFTALGIRSGVIGWSVVFGAIHGLVAGAAFGMLPVLHPRMVTEPGPDAETVPAPGFLGLNMGMMGPVAIIAVHIVYGVVAGAVYAA